MKDPSLVVDPEPLENATDRLDASDSEDLDLVGGPFAVIESEPGAFTTLIRSLGITGLEVEEVYDIQPWALDHLKPKGLILCFLWRHDSHRQADFQDSAAQRVWFANQLSQDACASQAILNVLFNCPGINLGPVLQSFKADTAEMSPMMKGLAIANLKLLREEHNSMARPADIRGARSAISEATRDEAMFVAKAGMRKRKADAEESVSLPKKGGTSKAKKKAVSEDEVESYHFIGYIPAHGKVWELDGLKSGPLEVGELPVADTTEGWEDVVRPALRLKMEKYGGGSHDGGNIRFNLLALVDDKYEANSDALEILKRKRAALEERLNEAYPAGWRDKVHPDLVAVTTEIFSTLTQHEGPGPTFSLGFGARSMDQKVGVIKLDPSNLCNAWEECVRDGIRAKIAIEEEVQKALQAQTEHLKRTHDYEPFIREFLTSLHDEDLLSDLLLAQGTSREASTTSPKPSARKRTR